MSLQLERGVVGYWCPMLATTGLRLYDRSGRGNHGTLLNMDAASDWVTAKVRNTTGRVLDFDGSNDYVLTSTPPSGVFPLGSSARTMACWFRGPNAGIGGQQIMAYGGNAGAGQRFAIFHNTTTSIGCEISGMRSFIPITRSNNFRLLVMTMDGSSSNINSVKIYLDGVEGSEYTISGSSTIDTRNTGMTFGTISGAPNNNNFVGQIAEGVIWRRFMTPSEIRTLYRIGPGWFGKQDSRVFGYSEQFATGFKGYLSRRQSHLIGGGL